jgi:hypothetical protein
LADVQDYKRFIDGLVGIREAAEAKWIIDGNWSNRPEDKLLNDLLARLTSFERKALADVVQHARDSAIHDCLVFLGELFNLEGYALYRNGEPVPHEPFAEMHFDWVCRREGEEWPDERRTRT